MIKQYVAALASRNGEQLSQHDSYALYAALLEEAGEEFAGRLHSGRVGLVSQYLNPLPGRQETLWTVNLIGKEAVEHAAPALEAMKEIDLRSRGLFLSMEIIGMRRIDSLSELLGEAGGDMDCGRFFFRFLSSCAFRANDEYVNFPSVPLILGSLRQKWDAAFPAAQVSDPDAASALEAGVKITGYNLRGASFRMKGVSIPSFSGGVTLNARLSPPMLRLFRLLMAFAAFSGVGIKTTLGMGGAKAKVSPRPPAKQGG